MTTFSIIFAPAGTGKLPIDPLTATVLAEIAGLGEDAAADALWLAAPELEAPALVVDELAVLIPAVHAAADMLAAQVASASAAKR